MAKFTSTKTALAVAAGLFGLTLSVPAMASVITYDLEYTATTGTGAETYVSALLTVDTATTGKTVTVGSDTYPGFTVVSMTGTRDVYNYNDTTKIRGSMISSGTINNLVGFGLINNDNLIYVLGTNFTLDQFGIGFDATSINKVTGKTYEDWYSIFYDNTDTSILYEYYVENNTSNNIAKIVDASLTQVPAPVPLVLLGGGLLGLGVLRRRKHA